MKKILVIGSLNLDMVVNVDHMPSAGETILCGSMSLIPGGKGANQAYAAGRLGADVTMLGAVGADSNGEVLIRSLAEANVNVSHLMQREGVSTGLAMITVNREGDNSIVVISGANATVSAEDIDSHLDLIEQSDIVILQLEIPIETVCYAAKRAKKAGKTVILDPAPVPGEFPVKLCRYVDIIKPNETELAMLTGLPDVQERLPEAAGLLHGWGVRDVLVTLGDKGVYLDMKQGKQLSIPAVKVDAVDTTAAGDSFTAALAVMLAEGKTLEEAAQFANYVSALVVTKKGAQSSIPILGEVYRYIG